MKSLLQLLREEDKAVQDYQSFQEDYECFSKSDATKHIALEYGRRTKIAKDEIAFTRKEICEYLRLIGISGKETTEDEKGES